MPIQMYPLAAQGLPELDQGLNNRGHRNKSLLRSHMFVGSRSSSTVCGTHLIRIRRSVQQRLCERNVGHPVEPSMTLQTVTGAQLQRLICSEEDSATSIREGLHALTLSTNLGSPCVCERR